MIASVLGNLARAWLVLAWVAIAIVAILFLLIFWPFVREARSGPPIRGCGIAPPVRRPTRRERLDAIARAAEDLRAQAIEETRLMPGFEQRDPGDENDQVSEGLGLAHPPHVDHATHSRTTSLELLPKNERDLWRAALKAGL